MPGSPGATRLDDPAVAPVAASAAVAADALAQVLAGEVLRPHDPGYGRALGGDNPALVHRPGLVVRAASAEDVARTVLLAAAHGLGVGVRCTGRSATPTGPADILLDTSRLDRVTVDPVARTATVGAGVRWGAVLDAAAPYGLAAAGGPALRAGVVGSTLGGGLGPLARSLGLAADHVRSMDVVTPAGALVTATPTHHPDLFWALRGGGGAFGVVTAMTVDLFPARTLRAGTLWFDAVDAPAVLHRWRELAADLPDEVSTSVAWVDLPRSHRLPVPLRGRTTVAARYARHGDPDAPHPWVDALRRTAVPLLDTVGDLSLARVGDVLDEPRGPEPLVDRGGLLRALPPEAVDAFLGAVAPGSGVRTAEIRLLGGAIGRAAGVPDAVGGRDAAFAVHVVAPAGPDAPTDQCAPLQEVHGALAPWATGGAMLDQAGPRDSVTAALVRTAYGPVSYARLVALRLRLDPHGVLDPSARWSMTRGGR